MFVPFQGLIVAARPHVGFHSLTLISPYAMVLVAFGDMRDLSSRPGESFDHLDCSRRQRRLTLKPRVQ